LGLSWSCRNPVLSPRDKSLPSLQELLTEIDTWRSGDTSV
jgi:hypothetical protein